jgi:hypothetical protein
MLFDEGISVRKAVVNMFRDIMQSQPDHPVYQDIAVSLLERMSYPKEEESVRESIRLIFQQVWFSPPSEQSLLIMRKCLSEQFTPQSTASEHSSTSIANASDMHINFTTRQLVQIISLQAPIPAIQQLLRDLIHGHGEGDEVAATVKTRRASAQSYCERIVQALINILLSTEEQIAKLHSEKSEDSTLLADLGKHKAAVIATVAMLCEVHPPLVSPHIMIFLPYLKRSETAGIDINIAKHVIKMLEATATLQKQVCR